MSYSWSRYWKPVWFRDGYNYQKTHVEAWTQATDVSTGLYMICGRLTNELVISPTRKSLTRVAQGMIHEMELRVPLLHTTLGMCGQQEAHVKGCNTTDQAINDGDAMPFNHRKYLSLIMPGILVFIILKVVFDVHRGNQGSCWVPPPPRRPPENRSTAISNDSLTKMTSFVSRRHMEKMGFLQALQVLQTQFRMFGTFMLDNAHAGGSGMFIRKNLLPDRAAVTHEVTYQGRDLAIKVQPGESLLVIINFHFAPGPSLRSLRERLRRL